MAADERNMNRDPITDEPGAHPVGTGIGATGGAVAGATAGAAGGPIGAALGGVVGAVVGGLAGKEAAESINPTAEEAYWQDNYMREPYYESGRTFDDYGPAYRLGLTGRSRYEGDFVTHESKLAAEWDAAHHASRLAWPQARHASRAAWERLDRTTAMERDDVISTLTGLAECAKDGEFGFRASASQVQREDLKSIFARRAEECRGAAEELHGEIRRLGGTPGDGGTASGALHRGWVAVKAKLGTLDDHDVLADCERGEDAAVICYRDAFRQPLPADIKLVVQRQFQGAARNHDQIKRLRDEAKAAV